MEADCERPGAGARVETAEIGKPLPLAVHCGEPDLAAEEPVGAATPRGRRPSCPVQRAPGHPLLAGEVEEGSVDAQLDQGLVGRSSAREGAELSLAAADTVRQLPVPVELP